MGILSTLWAAYRRGRSTRDSSQLNSHMPSQVRRRSSSPLSRGDLFGPPEADATRSSGTSHPVPSPPPSRGDDRLWDALRGVIDPEVGLDIVTMGLVFDVKLENGEARVTHTLTTRGCPMEDILTSGMQAALAAVPGIDRVVPILVWEPAWHPGMIAEDSPTE